MIDPDRDYLLAKVIDLNATLNEYKNELNRQLDNNATLIEQKASLVEANAQALANAEGWKQAHDRSLEREAEAHGDYYDLLRAARKHAGFKTGKTYLKALGFERVTEA